MGRVARDSVSTLIVSAMVLSGLAGGAWGAWYQLHNPQHVNVLTNARQQTTQISYQGEQGVNALTLLKRHAQVQVKHYSFGDLVTAINGTPGNGPKYWTFYVNNKAASVGAGAYITKNSDTVTWKLQ